MNDGSKADTALSWLTNLEHFYFEFQGLVLIATVLFLVSAVFVINRAVDEIEKARSARVKADETFERLTKVLAAIEKGETTGIPLGKRVNLAGPVARKVHVSPGAVRARRAQLPSRPQL